MEKKKEIELMPGEYAILEFRDGCIALIQGSKVGEDKNGQKIVDFMIKPSEIMRKRYTK